MRILKRNRQDTDILIGALLATILVFALLVAATVAVGMAGWSLTHVLLLLILWIR